MQQANRFIAVDWGASKLRAYCCEITTGNQLILLNKATGIGVKQLVANFEQTLETIIKPFTEQFGSLPVFMAGHITSSLGWLQTPYLACPIQPHQIKPQLLHFNGGDKDFYVTPGLCYQSEAQQHDTMRGEEIQLVGLLERYPQYRIGQYYVCLPGTHCKWVKVENGAVTWIKTAITGELFEILVHHSMLLQTSHSPFVPDKQSFTAGMQYALEHRSENLVHSLFSVRTSQLFQDFSAQAAQSYLSGLLITADVISFYNLCAEAILANIPVILVGSGHLQCAYASAISQFTNPLVQIDDEEVILAGFAYMAGN
ncbi:2-dehydro-3-deoxygalactonokinase [Alishewanella sp. d11]|uniref:2-dehydro-3-deoxygalactonokinase n=1 Tax=Alishewanella sp. d11 TaxID=3414030 RepID=UPI003BF90159